MKNILDFWSKIFQKSKICIFFIKIENLKKFRKNFENVFHRPTFSVTPRVVQWGYAPAYAGVRDYVASHFQLCRIMTI